MSYTYTTTFTRTHAKHLASKVVADLYQCALLYDHPSPRSIDSYEEELTTLLAGGYVDTYEFGFKLNGQRVLTWHYTVGPAGDLIGDDRSGKLARGIDVGAAVYFNFLTHSLKWLGLSPSDRAQIETTLPIARSFGSAPADGNGHWVIEQGYSAGGILVSRRVFKPW